MYILSIKFLKIRGKCLNAVLLICYRKFNFHCTFRTLSLITKSIFNYEGGKLYTAGITVEAQGASVHVSLKSVYRKLTIKL